LVKLSERPNPGGLLQRKLTNFFRTPIISNEAYYRGVRPHHPTDPRLGPYLRILSWNIEKSFHIQEAIQLLTSEDKFRQMVDVQKTPLESEDFKNISRQRDRMLQANILILQEMDIGVNRSGYVDAARELAKALNMNYAYGAEQLEIDPVILGKEKILNEDGTVNEEASKYYAADPERYKGVFGSAVLSKYPIKKVQVFQLKNQAYDWYVKEKENTTFLENARRFGAETVFQNEVTREIKKGGRVYFRVDLDVPDVPGGTLTVINIHLEIKCEPIGRQIQMAEILAYVRGIQNPVIIAGDFNSAPTDLSPTSVSRTLKRTAENPTTWLSAGITYLSPHALLINSSRLISNVTKNFQDPTAADIPVIASNKVKGLFESMEGFKSSKGYTFDFRGDNKRSVNGNGGTLANSNQRDLKGFKTTFSVKRPLGPWIGKYRLDWFFVKSSYLKNPFDQTGPYRFAPHFGETLEELNTSLQTPLSDHHPNVIDLPFREPRL
ncbi:MAG TPA: endonuclease/exonuclease/phosphatase family protein, partial [Candidatus Omnitrophota bacterium]|nr:endonuclease/exonuclease/phosphatase family protein [Candidatus Omnitrophota bacterium]